MRTYKIEMRCSGHGWEAACPALGISVLAELQEDASRKLRQLVTKTGTGLLEQGKFLPPSDVPGPSPHDVYAEFHFDTDFEAANQAPARRNISMPAWLDARLRRNNIDASRLFQDAAMKELDRIELAGQSRGWEIRDLLDLELACPQHILDQYVQARVADLIKLHTQPESKKEG